MQYIVPKGNMISDINVNMLFYFAAMLETFHILDKDNSGCVTREEMKKAMQDNSVCEMTEKEMDAYFDRIDEDSERNLVQ